MRRAAIAGMASLAILGATLTHAQERPGDGFGRESPALTAEDKAAFLDARIAALKAGLRLTPAQDANWPAFEQALRNLSKLRADRMEAMHTEAAPADPIERLKRRADAVSRMGAALTQLADAAGPLYGSLDESQKHRFAMLAHFLHPMHHGFGHEMGFGHRQELGYHHGYYKEFGRHEGDEQ